MGMKLRHEPGLLNDKAWQLHSAEVESKNALSAESFDSSAHAPFRFLAVH
jgi:hypothetical protein